jgi:hypothetical protein
MGPGNQQEVVEALPGDCMPKNPALACGRALVNLPGLGQDHMGRSSEQRYKGKKYCCMYTKEERKIRDAKASLQIRGDGWTHKRVARKAKEEARAKARAEAEEERHVLAKAYGARQEKAAADAKAKKVTQAGVKQRRAAEKVAREAKRAEHDAEEAVITQFLTTLHSESVKPTFYTISGVEIRTLQEMKELVFVDHSDAPGLVIEFDMENESYRCTCKGVMGSGSYGRVYDFQISVSGDERFHLALKIDDSDVEYKISQKLFDKDCGVIRSTLLTRFPPKRPEETDEGYRASKPLYIYFMEKADGDLKRFKEEHLLPQSYTEEGKDKKRDKVPHITAVRRIKDICESIRIQLECILENEFVYTDMKLENCLYKDLGDGTFRYIIGDLGGAGTEEGGVNGAIFPPPEYNGGLTGGSALFRLRSDKQAKKNALSWFIGVMLYTLLPDVHAPQFDSSSNIDCPEKDSSFMSHNTPCKKTMLDDLLLKASDLLDHTFGKGYGYYLAKDPAERPDIEMTLDSAAKAKAAAADQGGRGYGNKASSKNKRKKSKRPKRSRKTKRPKRPNRSRKTKRSRMRRR